MISWWMNQQLRADMISQFNKFRLKAKQPKPLAGESALGLQLTKDGTGKLIFERQNEISDVKDDL